MTDYTIERNEKRCMVVLAGDLTALIVPDVQIALKKELAQGANEVIFDLKKTLMLDSCGIGLLVACRNSLLQKQGKISVINVSQDIMQLLQSMRMIDILNVSGFEKREA